MVRNSFRFLVFLHTHLMENTSIRRCKHAGALQRNTEQRCESQTRLQPHQHAHELICTGCLFSPLTVCSNALSLQQLLEILFLHSLSLSLVCLFLPYLLASFLPRLCEIDCAPLPSADAAVIEKHTLLRPRALPLSLSPSLTPIGWLIEVTSPYFSAWHPPSLSLSSCSVDSGHSFFTPSSTSCLL